MAIAAVGIRIHRRNSMVGHRTVVDQFRGIVFAFGAAEILHAGLRTGMEGACVAEADKLPLRCARRKENGQEQR